MIKEEGMDKIQFIGDKAHLRFDFHAGIKNTIKDVLDNP
jgi:hypothetical protein